MFDVQATLVKLLAKITESKCIFLWLELFEYLVTFVYGARNTIFKSLHKS